jgi:hypothetical protein
MDAVQGKEEHQTLGFADAEYRSAALRAYTLDGRALGLEGNLPGALDFDLLLALHAVGLGHLLSSF